MTGYEYIERPLHYKEAEPFTTQVKTLDFSKSVRDLKHDPKIDPEEGIKRTVEWMKWYYRIDKDLKPVRKGDAFPREIGYNEWVK